MKTGKKILYLGLVNIFILAASFSFAEEVFVYEIGVKYHKEICPFILKRQDIQKMDKALALEEGYAPCRSCYKEDLPTKNQLIEVKPGWEKNTVQ